jgi:WD40 repeat protein
MLKQILALLAVNLAIFSASPATHAEGGSHLAMRLHEQPFKFEFPADTYQNFFIMDIDDNGDDDLLIDRHMGLQWYFFSLGQFSPAGECIYRNSGYIYGIYDVDGDNHQELFHIPQPHNGRAFNCMNCFEEDLHKTTLYSILMPLYPSENPSAYDTCSAYVMNCFDADGNGSVEVYAAFNSLLDSPNPRSLRVYDGSTGELLWLYNLGPHLKNCILLSDPGHDPQIIVSTFATNNGIAAGGLADSCSYVLAFNNSGELLWKYETTGKGGWCDIAVGDIDKNGKQEVLATRYFGEGQLKDARSGDIWSVAILDPYQDGKAMRERALHTGTDSPHLADLTGGVEQEIIVIGQNKALYILDHTLVLLAKLDDRTHSMIHNIRDIDRNGSREIMCSGDGILMIRDSHGTLTAETPFLRETNPLCRTALIADINDNIYVVSPDRGYLRFYSYEQPTLVESFSGYSQLIMRSPWGIAIVLVLGAGIGALVSTLVHRSRRSAIRSMEVTHGTTAAAKTSEANENLLHAMIAFGHGGASMKTINRLRLHLENWERSTQGGDGRTFDGLVESFTGTVSSDLEQIVMLSRKAGVPDAVWSGLTPAAAKASSTLTSLRSSPPSFDGAHDTVNEAAASLEKIDNSIGGIRAQLRSVFSAPVLSVAMGVLSRLADEIEQMNVATSVTAAGVRSDHAFVASPVLDKVLASLVQNALLAMKDSTERKLDIIIGEDGGYLTIDVRDTGCGIAESDRERIFDRQYTTKDEGGFGLYYAREELAVFSGKIFVKDSKAGAGTTMRIVLRQSME